MRIYRFDTGESLITGLNPSLLCALAVLILIAPPCASARNRAAEKLRGEARAAEVEGIMLVKCTITTEGNVTNCQIIKPVPLMDQVTLKWLSTAKYTPVTFQGHPVAVSYVFTFRFKIR